MTEHSEEHEHNNEISIFRIIISIIFFILGFSFKPAFIIAYLIIGINILIKAVKNLFGKNIFDENLLMSIATLGAVAIGEYPEAVMVMLLYTIGEYLQDCAVENSQKSISDLINIRPDYAIVDGQKVHPSKVEKGQIVTVKTGEKIPLDGIISEGSASVDTSALTGEYTPKFLRADEEVLAGFINLDGLLKIKVTKEYSETTASKILQLINDASSKKAKAEKFITKFAKYYTPFVVLSAIFLAFVMPVIAGGNWIERALTFLVISCPCALVLSVPLTFFAGIGFASSKGILIKGGNYLEVLAKVRNAVFDKTGTLTKGVFAVQKITDNDFPELLKYAAYAESASNHPIAIAIKNAYGKELPTDISVKDTAGMGVCAQADGHTIKLGNAEFINAEPIDTDNTVVYLSVDGDYKGNIIISDEIKQNAKETIKELKNYNIKTFMLSGDTKKSVEYVQKELGLDNSSAQLLPNQKLVELERIMEMNKGYTIFLGDGINDAPVLMRADAGIAMGAIGSDAAIEAADVVIMDDNINKITDCIKISKKTLLIAKENIAFALFVKALFLVFAILGLASMWSAVFADVGVTLLAILNALRTAKE